MPTPSGGRAFAAALTADQTGMYLQDFAAIEITGDIIMKFGFEEGDEHKIARKAYKMAVALMKEKAEVEA